MIKMSNAGKAAMRLPAVIAVAAEVLAAGWSETVQAETLVSWELTSNASETPIQESETIAPAVSAAILTKGDGVIATTTAGFGGKDYEEGTDLVSALSSNNFLQISLTIAQCYTVSLQSIEYTLYRSSTGPTYFQWVCFTNEIECVPIDVPVNFTANGSNKRFTTDLSGLPIFPPNTIVALRLAAWEASKDTGTFLFRADNSKTDIIISGTSEREVSDELTLDPISDGAVNCGEEPFVARLGIFGDSGTGVTTNVTTSAAITGTTNLVDGVFTYAPTKADAALSPITFIATVTKDGEIPVSQSFDVIVNVISPSIGEITAQQCYAGDTNMVALTLSGDYAEEGELVSTNAVCLTPGTTGSFSRIIDNGIFWYAPSVDDIAIANENYGVIGFKVVLTVGDMATTNVFTVAVSKQPDFLEDFEVDKAHSVFFNPTETFIGKAASWRGTNFNVNTFSGDYGRGTKTAKFRESGYIEMTTAKPNGAGMVSFWHKFANSANITAEGSYVVEISNNGGASWRGIGSPVVVSTNLQKTVFSDVNLGGSVQLRFTYTGTPEVKDKAAAILDDIEISDYYGSVEIDPAIGEIPNQTIHADETCEVEILFYGDEGLTKSVECTTPGVTGECSFDALTEVFTFEPALGDLELNGGVIGFTAYLKDGEDEKAARSFTITLLPPEAKWLELRANSMVKENFDLIGGDADAEMPAPWRVAHTNTLFGTNFLSYSEAKRITDRRATSASGEISINNAGIYNMGTNTEDRAVGFLSSNGSSSQYRTCALMVPVKNVGTAALGSINVRYRVEKWRNGRSKTLALFISIDGVSWAVAGDEWKTETIEDTKEENGQTKPDTAVLEMGADPTLATINGKIALPEPLPAGETIYLGWFYLSNDANCVSAQALAIDDVRISAGNPDVTMIMMK